MLAFEKYEGLGNDFVVVDATDDGAVTRARAAEICDRRRGVGADGVLLVLPPRDPAAAARMRVINADGSVPEMCGNGLRCVALHYARARGLSRAEVVFDTDAGLRPCTVDADAGTVTIDMGVIALYGARALDLGDRRVDLEIADAGNPHAIAFGEFSRADVDALGPRIATHASFPNGTNAEFARVRDGAIDLVVWERGVGVTLACGTGACATAAVACARGLAPFGAPIAVNLPGGALEVTIAKETGRAKMRGPARRAFVGNV